jgi:hypothetical protein
MWLVGAPAPETLALAPITSGIGIDASRIQSVGISARLDQGLLLTARAQMTESSGASETASSLRGIIPLMDSAMPAELADVVNRIVVESAGPEMRLDMSLRLDELRYLSTQ